MQELNITEVEQVSGGIILLAALAALLWTAPARQPEPSLIDLSLSHDGYFG
ncbi:hypothetical protein ACUHMQ_01040 [Chitinimonas sp. PSY-7]|uniref:hypothetical protein n=1 Tax=Chitinimonas sp. PSY-7 TaxID=3459088 RepID=UPI0040401471